MNRLNGCTIVSKNYLSYARVLASSFLNHHPGSKFYVLLVDEIDDCFDPSKELFEFIEIKELEIPNFRAFCFKYNIMELNTAAKPFFLSYLLKKFNLKKIAYFDPDILIYRTMQKLSDLLDQYSIVLTPHITEPIEDFSCKPNELHLLVSGTYNLGFIAISYSETTEKFLAWWERRLLHFCLHRSDLEIFVDQKWINLVPGLFKDVFIMTDPGCNMAYWNLHSRKLSKRGNHQYEVNGEPLYFYHFSGYDPDEPKMISKYQTRYTFKGQPILRELFDQYGQLQKDNGYEEARKWSYAYDRFDNRVRISPFIRKLYHSLGDKGLRFGDPFLTQRENTFFSWLNAPVEKHSNGAYLTNLHYEIYKSSEYLRVKFPGSLKEIIEAYSLWLIHTGQPIYQLDSVFFDSLIPFSGNQTAKPNLLGRIKVILKRRRTYPIYLKIELFLRRLLGEELFLNIESRMKRIILGAKHHPRSKIKYSVELPSKSIRSVVNELGINIVGYITTESGIGEGVRANILAVKSAHIPVALNNFEENSYRKQDDTYQQQIVAENPFDINLIQVNADQVPVFYEKRGPEYFKNKYNIGFWAWELSSFPKEWKDRFDPFDEIWTYSAFSQEAISMISPVPVLKIMPAIQIYIKPEYDRKHFGIPQDCFVFYFMFDFYSVYERKNPQAIINAFKSAFSPRDNVSLIIKFNNSQTNLHAKGKLYEMSTGFPIRLIDGYISREEINGLLNVCDCYVSLHRSEGFGITIAEAMSLGKPVIATDYSSTSEFMNVNNGFPVRYELKEIEKDHGYYKKGNVWADADTEDAARLMRLVYENRDLGKRIGNRASLDIKNLLDPERVGSQIRERLEQLVIGNSDDIKNDADIPLQIQS